jgi:acyl-coenzyme A thioesterase PaaI-like protein
MDLRTRFLLGLLRFYPPYLGAGIRVTQTEPDFSAVEVEMKLHRWNQNYVGTHFGGSLYSMCDPFFMLMVLRQLGDGYVVWDKSATIDFLKPGRGTVRARMEVPKPRIEQIRAEVASQGKSHPSFEAELKHLDGEIVARVTKVLSVRPKRP